MRGNCAMDCIRCEDGACIILYSRLALPKADARFVFFGSRSMKWRYEDGVDTRTTAHLAAWPAFVKFVFLRAPGFYFVRHRRSWNFYRIEGKFYYLSRFTESNSKKMLARCTASARVSSKLASCVVRPAGASQLSRQTQTVAGTGLAAPREDADAASRRSSAASTASGSSSGSIGIPGGMAMAGTESQLKFVNHLSSSS